MKTVEEILAYLKTKDTEYSTEVYISSLSSRSFGTSNQGKDLAQGRRDAYRETMAFINE